MEEQSRIAIWATSNLRFGIRVDEMTTSNQNVSILRERGGAIVEDGIVEEINRRGEATNSSSI